jgi:hypothetical protein
VLVGVRAVESRKRSGMTNREAVYMNSTNNNINKAIAIVKPAASKLPIRTLRLSSAVDDTPLSH